MGDSPPCPVTTDETPDMVGEKKWGSGSRCPACDKSVYPNETVFAADRKAWHKRCINCAVQGCRNELFDRGMNKTPDGQNICDHCYEEMYDPRHYGPPPGMESLEERRRREALEAEEREEAERDRSHERTKEQFWFVSP